MNERKIYKEYNPEQLFEEGDLDTLYLCCENMIFMIFKRFTNVELSEEDKYEIGYISFMKTVKAYKPEKGLKFNTLLSKILTNEILMASRKQKQRTKYNYSEVSLDNLISNDSPTDTSDMKLSDILPSDINIEEECIAKLGVDEIMDDLQKVLTKRQLPIMLKLLELHSETKTAEAVGKTRSYVNRVKSITRRKLLGLNKEKYNRCA